MEDYGNMNNIMTKNKKPTGKRKGTLPSYWVNLDELAKVLLDVLKGKEVIDYGKQKIDGLFLEVNHSKDEQKKIWEVKEDFAIITGIDFFANDVRNIGYTNSFDMYINDELYFDNIYIKETDEYKRFNVRRLLKKEDKIQFLFKNKTKEIDTMAFHIHYLGGLPVKKYEIICLDIDTNEIITRYDYFVIAPTQQTVCPNEIDEYIIMSECVEIDTENDTNNIIEFYYQKESNQVIDHNYDFIFKLYWESSIDLDFHCEIDNCSSEISFSNKELKLDDENCGWLDYDYTSWSGTPEIITILGFKDRNATLKVNLYRGTISDNATVTIVIAKKEKSKEIVLEEYMIKGENFRKGKKIDICKINLGTEEITKLI